MCEVHNLLTVLLSVYSMRSQSPMSDVHYAHSQEARLSSPPGSVCLSLCCPWTLTQPFPWQQSTVCVRPPLHQFNRHRVNVHTCTVSTAGLLKADLTSGLCSTNGFISFQITCMEPLKVQNKYFFFLLVMTQRLLRVNKSMGKYLFNFLALSEKPLKGF